MQVLRFLLRWTLYVALAVFGVLAIVYAGLLYVNWQDDPPDPQIAATLNAYPAQIPAERNGYFAWIGVMGPEAVPPHEWGQRWFDRAQAADAANPSGTSLAEAPPVDEARADTWPDNGPCQKIETCLEDVAADPDGARAALAKVRVTLERADVAMTYPDYQEAFRPNFGSASLFPPVPARWTVVSATRFAVDLAEGHHTHALDRLAREIKFHTAQAAGAETLVAKLVAVAYLRNDYLLLATYGRRFPQQAMAHHAQIKAMLAPLPPEATSLAAPFRSEIRSLARLLGNLRQAGLALTSDSLFNHQGGWQGWVADGLFLPFYLPNATVNEVFHLRVRDIEAEWLDEAVQYRAAVNEAYEQNEAYKKSLLDHIVTRNLVGRILVGISAPDYRSYQFRRDDLLVLRAAVALRNEKRLAGWSAARMSEVCAAPELVHRMTGSGPQWDDDKQALVYEANPLRKGGTTLIVPM